MDIKEKLPKLTAALATTARGKYAIALSGSLAKGVGDDKSDIDLYVFYEEPKSYEERRTIIQDLADPGTPFYVSHAVTEAVWGGSMDFMYQGTPVETVIRSMAATRSVVEDCVEGRFTITPASWTTNGYYSYIYLAEFGFLKPIDDETGYIDACRKLIDRE